MLTVLLLASLLAAASAQCTGNDHPSCASWKNNGYCSNTAVATVKLYCGVTCGLCNRDGSQTALGGGNNLGNCNDANSNCAAWQKNNQFCTNPGNSNAMKLQYCCRTCRPFVYATTTAKPTTQCTPAPGLYALKSVHGTYLSRNEGSVNDSIQVDMSPDRKSCEQWHLDVYGDKIALRPFCNGPAKFLRANPGLFVDLADVRLDDEVWLPVPSKDGSCSLKSRYGFLTADTKAKVYIVNKNAASWEQFWFEPIIGNGGCKPLTVISKVDLEAVKPGQTWAAATTNATAAECKDAANQFMYIVGKTGKPESQLSGTFFKCTNDEWTMFSGSIGGFIGLKNTTGLDTTAICCSDKGDRKVGK